MPLSLNLETQPLSYKAVSEGNARRRPLGGCWQCGVTELQPEPVTPPGVLVPALPLCGWCSLLGVNWVFPSNWVRVNFLLLLLQITTSLVA